MTAWKSPARATSTWYSIITITGPASGSGSTSGAGTTPEGRAGLRSSSSPPATLRRRVSSSTSGPAIAAAMMLVGTLVAPATWPQTAAPAALPPISAIW